MENNKNIQNWNNEVLNSFSEITTKLASEYTFWNTLNTKEIQNIWAHEIYDWEREIREWWEYKVYKLKLNGIAPIKWDFMKAKKKIDAIPKLKNLIGNDFEIENILPLIIKESRMDNSQVSSTGAKWYLQITQTALKDVNKRYWLQDLNLDREDPVDNLIIWIIYYMERNMEIINSLIRKSWKEYNFSKRDKKELNILSYNIWAGRMVELLKKSNEKTLSGFKKYISTYLWCSWNATKKVDPYYKIEYYDYLDWKDKSSFTWSDNQKIAEWLRYLEIINWLDGYINQETSIVSLWTININEWSLFSQVKALRDDKQLFRPDASITDICKIILETNWFKETETPSWVELVLIKEALNEFLN